MNITWTYNDALSLVPGDYIGVLREDADAAIEHLSRITALLAQRLGGELSIDGLARLTLSTSDALELLEQYPNRPRPTTADDVQQTLDLIEMVRRWAMVKLHQQAFTQGGCLIAAERRRQIEVEGWTPEHDDQHTSGEIAGAAACYALASVDHWGAVQAIRQLWPWPDNWWKPGTARRNLEKAGALIAAELDRLQRMEATSHE